MDTNTTRWQRVLARAAVSLVALVGATVSYAHMHEVAAVAGEAWRAWLLPLSVDGMIAAASLGAWQARRRGEPVPTMTALSLTIGLLVSVGANVAVPLLPSSTAHAPVALSAIVAAWPAVALGLAFEEMLRSQVRSGDTADMPGSDTVRTTAEVVDTPEIEWPTAWTLSVDELLSQCRHGDTADDTAPDTAPEWPTVWSLNLDALVPQQWHTDTTIDTASEPVPAAGSDDAKREAAREEVRQADRDGVRISGKKLGKRYGRGEAWGRNQIRAVRAETTRRPALVAVET